MGMRRLGVTKADDLIITTASGIHAGPMSEFALYGILHFVKEGPYLLREKAAHRSREIEREVRDGRLRKETSGLCLSGDRGRREHDRGLRPPLQHMIDDRTRRERRVDCARRGNHEERVAIRCRTRSRTHAGQSRRRGLIVDIEVLAKYLAHLVGQNPRHNIDGAAGGSGAEYVNHSCEPNLVSRIVRGHILYVALRDIQPGEELTIDYRFDKDVEKVVCRCGSANCRGTINLLK